MRFTDERLSFSADFKIHKGRDCVNWGTDQNAFTRTASNNGTYTSCKPISLSYNIPVKGQCGAGGMALLSTHGFLLLVKGTDNFLLSSSQLKEKRARAAAQGQYFKG